MEVVVTQSFYLRFLACCKTLEPYMSYQSWLCDFTHNAANVNDILKCLSFYFQEVKDEGLLVWICDISQIWQVNSG